MLHNRRCHRKLNLEAALNEEIPYPYVRFVFHLQRFQLMSSSIQDCIYLIVTLIQGFSPCPLVEKSQ
jgi:hypothetical protein